MNQQTSTNYTTAEAVVEELIKEGVEVIFGIVSIHNMPIYDAILREGSIKMVAARGESGAVNMADGYARATGKLGVVLTSTGAGAGNGAGALTEAWNAGIPLLHITGNVASSYLGTGKRYIHECKDQLMMMEGASKSAQRLSNPAQTSSVLRGAIVNAKQSPAGPITVEIPIDLQSVVIPESQFIHTEEVSETPTPKEKFVISEEIVQKIVKAKRPIIWAGGGVISAEASQELKELAEKLGAAVITSQTGKGVIPEDHPQCIGNFAADPTVKELLEKSDLLLSIGVRFRGNETNNWTVPVPEEHIGIDADEGTMNRNYPVTHGLIGDAKYLLQSLLDLLSKQNISADPGYLKEVEGVRNEVRTTLREKLGPYEQIADEMRRLMPRDAILVRDVTVPASFWGSRIVDIYEPRTSIHASGGGIGQALPTGIGAQISRKDRPVVVMAGDGGFMVNVGEMATAVQENLPMVILLFDDAGYGVLRRIQDAAYGRRAAVDLHSPDFVELAKSMGFAASRIGSPEEFATELEAAIARKKPSMVVVDMEAVGPPAQKYEVSPAVARSFQPKED